MRRHEGLPARRAHHVRDSPAPRLGHQIPQAGDDGRSRAASQRTDTRDLRQSRGDHYEGAHLEGSRASVREHPAAGDNQSAASDAEGEEFLQADARVTAPEAEVLGASHVGTGILLRQFGERDGRSNRAVHRAAES